MYLFVYVRIVSYYITAVLKFGDWDRGNNYSLVMKR